MPYDRPHAHAADSEHSHLVSSQPSYTSIEAQVNDSDNTAPVKFGSGGGSGSGSAGPLIHRNSAVGSGGNGYGSSVNSSGGGNGILSRYTKAELIARTPWKQFVSHPVALALLASAFGYVSLDAIGGLAMFVV